LIGPDLDGSLGLFRQAVAFPVLEFGGFLAAVNANFDRSGRLLEPDLPSLQEALVKWNKRLRQMHRWTAIVFTATVIATFIALAQREPVVWLSYVPLLPLALLLLTGLYLFAAPYALKRRARRMAADVMIDR